ncbi:MAG: hypothetical protein MUE69_08035 [Myxococcota bacterium]|jgi:hypothetical protein|nr:hypothetical protein [Myxococcota bacterium]
MDVLAWVLGTAVLALAFVFADELARIASWARIAAILGFAAYLGLDMLRHAPSGPSGPLLVGLGVALASLAEARGGPKARGPAWELVAVTGLAAHAVLDGARMAAGHADAFGVLLHRVPEAVAVVLALPRLHARAALVLLACGGAVGMLGFAGNDVWRAAPWTLAQSVAGGVMLRLLWRGTFPTPRLA